MGLAVADVALFAAAVVLIVGNGLSTGDLGDDPVTLSVAGLAFAIVGAVIVVRAGHRLGWLYLVLGSSFVLNSAVVAYAERAVVLAPGTLPFAELSVYLNGIVSLPGFLGLPLVGLLYPTGRPLTPRWRWAVWWLVVAGIANLVTNVDWLIRRPVPAELLVLGGADTSEAFELGDAAYFAILAMFPVAGLSMIVRFVRSRGPERQQMKWFAVAAIIMMVPIPGSWPLIERLGAAAAITLVPVATGVAIMRYRLYDIDRIIGRVVVYAVVTAALATAYVGLILGVQAFLGPDEAPDVIVAGSTLVAAALFRPVRSRVQSFVDHRFYRRRYDAGVVVAAFVATLRDGVDQTLLSRDLCATVGTAIQPSTVSLWLPSTEGTA